MGVTDYAASASSTKFGDNPTATMNFLLERHVSCSLALVTESEGSSYAQKNILKYIASLSHTSFLNGTWHVKNKRACD